MADPAAVHDTFILERNFSKPPAKVFAAFADPAKKRRWHGEHPGHEVLEATLDFRIGGAEHWRFRMGPTTPIAGKVLTNDGVYLDIVPDRRIVTAYAMAMEGRPFSASLVTFELAPRGDGTDLVLIHQGVFFEGADGPEMRKGGWNVLLDKLQAEVAA
jgi:uncharacterized protein YndB with AHSA1/START domain